MKPLRILHTESSLGWGGQEIRILTEARKFIEEGHSVHLACDPASNIIKAAPDYGLETTPVPLRKRSLAGLSAIRSLVRSWRPDVIGTHSSTDAWLSAAARIGLHDRPAIVRTRHLGSDVARDPATRWIYNRGADFVMATSDSIVSVMTGDGFLPVERIAAVPTGIDTARFTPGEPGPARTRLGLPSERFIFVIVATLRQGKGHAFILEALATMPEAMLAIVGDGPQEENLKAQVERLGLADRVVMAGRRDDAVEWLRAADCFLLPSIVKEGVPQAMVQAMACEVPVIATPMGGISEVAAGLAATRIVKAGDASELAAAMRSFMTEPPPPADRALLRARVEERYSADLMYRRAKTAYETAIARVRPSRD